MPAIDLNHRVARAQRDRRESPMFILSEPESLELLRLSMDNTVAGDWKRILHSKPHPDDIPEGEQQ